MGDILNRNRVYVLALVAFCLLALSISFVATQVSSAEAFVAVLPEPVGAETYTYNFTVLGQTYQVRVTTNSSLSDFGWTPDGIGVQFRATTPDGSTGYCDFTVPQSLLGTDLALLVDGSGLVKDVNYTQSTLGNDFVFHLSYGGGSKVIEAKASTTASTPSASPSATAASNATAPLQIWTPKVENAVFAATAAVGSVAAAAAVMSAVRPAEEGAWRYFEKIKEPLPDQGRKWASDFVESKKKLEVEEKRGRRLLPTKNEAVAYAVGILVLTLCYGYAKVAFDWAGFLEVAPIILATFMIVEFVKIYVTTAIVRGRGVWAEHKVWYLGLVLLGVTTLAFRMPLSSPTRSVRHGPKFSKRLEAFVASVETVVNLAFTGVFFAILIVGESVLQNSGLTLLGRTGLAFCVMMSFFEILPIPPMASREIWEHNKALWGGLFAVAASVFVAWLLLL